MIVSLLLEVQPTVDSTILYAGGCIQHKIESGMIERAFYPLIGRQTQIDLYVFKASWSTLLSSRSAEGYKNETRSPKVK